VFRDSQLRTASEARQLYYYIPTLHGCTEKFQLNFRSYLRELFKNNSHRPRTTRPHDRLIYGRMFRYIVTIAAHLGQGFSVSPPPSATTLPPSWCVRDSILLLPYIIIIILIIIILGIVRSVKRPSKELLTF